MSGRGESATDEEVRRSQELPPATAVVTCSPDSGVVYWIFSPVVGFRMTDFPSLSAITAHALPASGE